MASDLPQQPESKIRWYLEGSGDPVSIYARANSRDPARPQLADNFSAIVNCPDGAYAIVSQSLSAFGHHQMAKVVGTEGAIWADWGAADARSGESHFGLRYGLGDDVTEVELKEDAGNWSNWHGRLTRWQSRSAVGRLLPVVGWTGAGLPCSAWLPSNRSRQASW